MVLGIEWDRAKLGFRAPRNIPILRKELYDLTPQEFWDLAHQETKNQPHTPEFPSGGMLVLTREIDESIIIDENINVMLLGIERDRAKLGIAAPRNVEILREELLQEGKRPYPEGRQTPRGRNL